MRARVVPAVPALLAAALLAGCTTAVDGAGRPGPGVASAAASASASPDDGPSPSTDQALATWSRVQSAISRLDAVTVTGTFAGAAFGDGTDAGAPTIQASFGRGPDGAPLARTTVTTPVGSVEVRATGGTAWANATAPLLQALGYKPDEVAAVAGKWGVLADDSKGLDVFASLDAFLQICAPDGEDDLTIKSTRVDGKAAAVLHSELADGQVTVSTTPPRLLTSQYSGDDLTFAYPGTALTVQAPPADQVVTIADY